MPTWLLLFYFRAIQVRFVLSVGTPVCSVVKTWCGVSPRTFDKITLATINRLSKVFYINVVKTVLDDGASKEIASYSKFLTGSKGS
jgi:hypothetical protein